MNEIFFFYPDNTKVRLISNKMYDDGRANETFKISNRIMFPTKQNYVLCNVLVLAISF